MKIKIQSAQINLCEAVTKMIWPFLVLLLFTFPIFSQPQADSLKTIWSDSDQKPNMRFAAYESYYLLLIESDPKAIVSSSITHLEFAKRVNSKKEILLALFNQSNAFCTLGENDKALRILETAYEYAKKFKDSVSILNNLANRGAIHYSQGNYKESVRYFTRSLKVSRDMKLYDKEAIILNNLGNVFDVVEDYKQAMDYYEESLAVLTKLKKEEDSEYIWMSLANTSLKVNNIEKATKYSKKALHILRHKNNKIGLAQCYYFLSKIELFKGNKKLATEHAKRSLSFSLETGIDNQVITYKIQLGELLFEENTEEAIKIGKEALNLIHDGTANLSIVEVYDLLYKCYKKQNKTDLSLAMLEKYNLYNARLIKQKRNFDIVREAIRSEFDKELRDSKKESAASINKLKDKQRTRIYSIVSIALTIFLVLLFYYRKRMISNRIERNILLDEIESIKSKNTESSISAASNGFKLDREKIEKTIGRKMNETDWTVLNILFDDPVISNKNIAEKAFLSVDGIGSSLRRMYDLFDIKESKYKKISLLLETARISNQQI